MKTKLLYTIAAALLITFSAAPASAEDATADPGAVDTTGPSSNDLLWTARSATTQLSGEVDSAKELKAADRRRAEIETRFKQLQRQLKPRSKRAQKDPTSSTMPHAEPSSDDDSNPGDDAYPDNMPPTGNSTSDNTSNSACPTSEISDAE